jgi:AcrR family transcriptional regulator
VEAVREASSDLTRRERRKVEVRDRIVEAGIALFEERGFAATRVSEICARADIAHKTFFNHVPSKQDLLRAIARYSLEQLLADIDEARTRPGSTAERLRFFFHRIADNAEQAGPLRRELLNEIVHVAHDSGTEPEQARRLHAAFGSLVRDGLAGGDLSTRHGADTLTEMIMCAFYVLMFNWANLDGYPLRRQAESAAGFLVEAMSAFPARSGAKRSAPGRGNR